ncbi:MAG: 50S ribosomal protein L9 [Alphaproteobacteria bacterium]|nr:50S ribosomal protein L9 [Alphaproteobacteria bacterium]
MEVILLEKVGRIGQIGTVVKVKPGYARNFLLPKKKALRATKDNIAYFEAKRSEIEAANAQTRAAAEKSGKTLDGKKFTTIRQASEVGQLFGSVTVRDIAELLKAGGFDVERQYILLAAPIKTVGVFQIPVRLHADVSVNIALNIARTEDEAKIQEKTGKAAKSRETAVEDKKAEAEINAEAFFEKPPEELAAPAEEKAEG